MIQNKYISQINLGNILILIESIITGKSVCLLSVINSAPALSDSSSLFSFS